MAVTPGAARVDDTTTDLSSDQMRAALAVVATTTKAGPSTASPARSAILSHGLWFQKLH
jgi:hypothetical protein